ncbi:MAG: hypothetical protein EZS28_005073 [Streblomastix strix]|uniref:ATPase AAA-type core domain-containing protein n=1 Tax=Streblomastix strix TaxID=222440 RepID=A0A5J4WWZ6_9EUKA|nr:MAG: hypothetical protein EZS28_005073 [Streblomastix strix]
MNIKLQKPLSVRSALQEPAVFDPSIDGTTLIDAQLRPFCYTVIGPPQSGKTTLARLVAAHLGVVYISFESSIRRIVRRRTDKG